MAKIVLALFLAVATVTAVPLPRLKISEHDVTISGISSGADFAVQFHVAFSDLVNGAAIYAGEPYHCAVLRFPGDELVTCASQPFSIKGPGCTGPLGAPCEGCPPGYSVLYDHCKFHSDWVNATSLVEIAKQRSSQGLVDHVSNLKDDRVWLYRGTLDRTYLDGAVNKTQDFYLGLVDDPANVYFESTIPSQHAMPTLDYGTPCGVSGNPPAMEDCHFDGAGAALQFLFRGQLRTPSGPVVPVPYLTYDQRPYFTKTWPGLADNGFLYAPDACVHGARCRLHVVFHGCTMSYVNPLMNTSYVEFAGYNRWADANNIVMLYPQSGGYREHNVNGTFQEDTECWDSYGQTGVAYDTHDGLQMASVRNMVRALTGF